MQMDYKFQTILTIFELNLGIIFQIYTFFAGFVSLNMLFSKLGLEFRIQNIQYILYIFNILFNLDFNVKIFGKLATTILPFLDTRFWAYYATKSVPINFVMMFFLQTILRVVEFLLFFELRFKIDKVRNLLSYSNNLKFWHVLSEI